MTVCIAAICDKGKNIVLAADQLLSSEMKVSESRLYKMIHIHQRWMAMFAFTDLDVVSDVTERMKQKLSQPGHFLTEEVRRRVLEGYVEVRLERAEAMYLKPRNWNLADYKRDGREKLGNTIFDSIDTEIASFDLGVQFLIAGFDAEDTACLFSIEHPGLDTDHSVPGHWAIGSGAYNALAALAQREIDPLTYLSKTIYFVYEAKKFAEYAKGVGKKTILMVITQGRWGIAGKDEYAALDAIWDYAQPKGVDQERLKQLQACRLVQEFPAEN